MAKTELIELLDEYNLENYTKLEISFICVDMVSKKTITDIMSI